MKMLVQGMSRGEEFWFSGATDADPNGFYWIIYWDNSNGVLFSSYGSAERCDSDFQSEFEWKIYDGWKPIIEPFSIGIETLESPLDLNGLPNTNEVNEWAKRVTAPVKFLKFDKVAV